MMTDSIVAGLPSAYEGIKAETERIHFSMASDLQTGCLLKTLAASKKGGTFLELGTGSGLATSWIMAGMDETGRLVTVENNALLVDIARKHLPADRVEYIVADAYEWIPANSHRRFDLIFADAMPGKYDLFEETTGLLNSGGFYIIDDMLPQPNWPAGHENKVEEFVVRLEQDPRFNLTKLAWSTGLIIAVRK
jgi:predicted O-methyltransferase YrrM